jgi:hypothetical protein
MNAPTPVRRWAGALGLPAFFLALIGATLTDPLDDSADGTTQVHQAVAHLGALKATFALELLAAALMVAATMGIVGAVRARGAALAGAGAVLGVLGGVGLAMIGTGHVYLAALAQAGSTDAGQVVSARDSVAGPLGLLFFAAPLAVVVLCAAVVRAGLAPWPLLVVVGVFVLLEVVPTPFEELPALIAGLVAAGWTATALVAADRRAVVLPGRRSAAPVAAA